MEQEVGAPGHRLLEVLRAEVPGRGDGPHRTFVVGDEVVRAQEDVELPGEELVGGGVETDPVHGQEDVVVVVVHLRIVDVLERVLDGQGMEVKRLGQDGRLLLPWGPRGRPSGSPPGVRDRRPGRTPRSARSGPPRIGSSSARRGASPRRASRAGPAPRPDARSARGRASTTRSRDPRGGRSRSTRGRRRARRTPRS